MPYTAAQVSKLTTEFADDPLTRGYSGMNDSEKLASLLVEDRDNPRTTMSAGEVMEAIDGAEFAALSVADKARVDRVLWLGAEVIIGPGNAHNAVQELLVFGGASNTITALAGARDLKFSRSAELGLPDPILNDVVRA